MATEPQEGIAFNIEDQYSDDPATVEIPETPPIGGNTGDQGGGDSGSTELTPEFAAELGGRSFDANGNLVNDKNTIVLAAAKVKEKLTAKTAANADKAGSDSDGEDQGDEEGEVLSINAEGDLVDAKGEVVRKKGTFTYDEKTGSVAYEDDPLVPSLAASYRERGYALVDANGAPLEFEDSQAGLDQLAASIAAEHFANTQEQFFEANPEVLRLYEHTQNGGDPYTYYRERGTFVDYNKLDIPKEDQAGRVNFIRNYLTTVKNLTGDDLENMVDVIKTQGKVDDRYDAYLTDSKAIQQKNEKAEADARKAAQAEEIKAQREYWDGIQNAINAGNIGDYKLPDTDKAAFFEYLSKPGDDGLTSYQRAVKAMKPEEMLALQYQVFKGMKLDALVAIKVKSEKADLIASRKIKKIIPSGSPSFRSTNGNGGGVNVAIDSIV